LTPGQKDRVFQDRERFVWSSVPSEITQRALPRNRTSAPLRPSLEMPLNDLRTPMEAIEHAMKSWNGAELFYREWLPQRRADKALLLFHRGHEHSGRWQKTVESLGLEDVAVFAWDARGHVQSPGTRGGAQN